MKTVYTVLNSRAELVGVYSTAEKAQQAKAKHQDGGYQCRIIIVELDA